MSEILYTTGEVAEHLKVEESTIRSWLRTGKIAGIKLPNGFYRITALTFSIIYLAAVIAAKSSGSVKKG